MNQGPIFRCSICEQELVENASAYVCSFCGKHEPGEWTCANGHYTCEDCRLASPEDAVERVCRETHSANPREIADLIMRHPAFHHHGAEHHLLVAPSLLTAVANATGNRVDPARIRAALKRLSDIPIGVCSSRGDCGACVGAGAALAMIAGAFGTPAQRRSRALRTTGGALMRLGEMGGLRCCKQSVYVALEIGCRVLAEELTLSLNMGNLTCGFSPSIPDCKKENCPYY
ncbi:MAG: DUF5714 domain-containing protein [Candidatus Omnitrophota bacterium]